MFSLLLNLALCGSSFYVMAPLDLFNGNQDFNYYDKFNNWLQTLKSANVDGIMIDVWWGLTETSEKNYKWDGYQKAFDMISSKGLKIIPVFSFHKCGGNVGDTCNIPLPGFVTGSSKNPFFRDSDGHVDNEYISFAYDEVTITTRTPMQMYADWMDAFKNRFGSYISSGKIYEIEVGTGPCGEARYPAYRSGWVFPGVGALQCFDEQALLQAKEAGVVIPEEANEYNDSPVNSEFWCNIQKNQDAIKFYQWYSQILCDHTETIMKEAKRIFKGDIKLILKVPGIHWWSEHVSRACEANCGLYNYSPEGVYEKLIKICKECDAEFSFTCLEMSHRPEAGSDPVGLINGIIDTCNKYGVSFGGENALECYTQREYDMLVTWRDKCHSFTFLRLGNEMMKFSHWRRFKWLVAHM